MSPTLAYIYSSVAVLGGATLLWSLGDLRAGNLMFDGGSVCEFILHVSPRIVSRHVAVLYSSAIVMYLYSVIPSTCAFNLSKLTVLIKFYFATTDLLTNFKSLPLPFPNQGAPMASTLATAPTEAAAVNALPPFPPTLRGPTLDLASSHLICSVALTGVLLLQAGRWWAEQQDDDDEEDEEAVAAEETEPKEESKKTS